MKTASDRYLRFFQEQLVGCLRPQVAASQFELLIHAKILRSPNTSSAKASAMELRFSLTPLDRGSRVSVRAEDTKLLSHTKHLMA